MGDSGDGDPQEQDDGCLDRRKGVKWGMFCDPSVMDDGDEDLHSQSTFPYEDHPEEGRNMWSPMESKRFISGIEGRFEDAEDRFKHLANKLYQSRDIYMQARGACDKEGTGKVPTVKSGIAIPQARGSKTRRRSSKQANTDKKDSSHDIHNALTDLVSESLVYPHGANQRQFGTNTSRKSDAAYLNTTSDDAYCKPLSVQSSTSGLYSDVENGQHAATCAIELQPTLMSSTPRVTKKTSTFDCVPDRNHNLVITSSSHTSCGLDEKVVDEVSPTPQSNIVKDGRKKRVANDTDRGAFTAITSRSHADSDTTTKENSESVDRPGRVVKSRHKERSKATTGNIAQLSPKSRTMPESILTRKGNNIVIDPKIENIYIDLTNHDQVELSLNAHLKANNTNCNESISSISHIQKMSRQNCEVDSVKKRSNTARSVILKKSRTSFTQDETKHVRNKKSRSTYGTTNKFERVSSPNYEISLSNKTSKIYINNTYKDDSTKIQNDGIEITKKRSKSSFNNTSKVARMTGQNYGTEFTKKRSKHCFTNEQNDDTYFTKKGCKSIIGNTFNKAEVSGSNYEKGVTIKRSQSDFANISNVPRTTVQKHSIDISMKKSKSTIITNASKKKRKYSSPYAQSNINKGGVNAFYVKQKSSDPSSRINGHSENTIAVYVKPKALSLCSQLKKPNKGSNQKLLRQSTQLCNPKKGGKGTIYNDLHLKQKPSHTKYQFDMSNKESRDSITTKFEVKRKHKKSQHRFKKPKKTSKSIFGEHQSKIEEETLECLRSYETCDSHNEQVEDGNPEETMDTPEGTKTPGNFEPHVFHDINVDPMKVFEKQSDTIPDNCWESNKHYCLTRKDLQSYQLAETENEQSPVKSITLSRSESKHREISYKHTVFLVNGLQKHYLIPTISSQLKRVMKSPFITRTKRIMPFVTATSTMPSHNINVQIQNVISIMRKKTFTGDTPNMPNMLKSSCNSAFTLPTIASVRFKSRGGQDSCRSLRQGVVFPSPSTQLSTSPSRSRCREGKPLKRLRRPADVWTSHRDGVDNTDHTGCCCSPSRSKSNNYQSVLDKYVRGHGAAGKTSLPTTMDADEVAPTETDGMRGRRLLGEILGYIYEDVQRVAENLKANSTEMVNEEEMDSIRARVEHNTAIVNETMKLMDEGKKLQNKYKRLAHAVTQDTMFDSHSTVTPSLRAPPITSRLRGLMLNIRHFKEELIQS